MTDEEAQALAAQVEQQKKDIASLTASGQEATKKFEDLNQAYQRDIGTLTAYATNLLRGGQQPQTPPEDASDPAVIEKRKWKEEVLQSVNEGLNPVVGEYYRNQRVLNRKAIESDPKHATVYAKYKSEVEKILDGQPPQVQANPEAYSAACSAVAAMHLDEIINERVEARSRPPQGEGEEELEEETTAPASRQRASSPSPPPSGASGSQVTRPKTRKIEPLSQEERFFARDVFGMEDAEYDTYSHDLTRDVFGFKDPKTGRMRGKV